jgi:hydroxyacylglutathione hydrolase
LTYTATVDPSYTASIFIKATAAAGPAAALKINEQEATSGTPLKVSLKLGDNPFSIVVKAPDGSATTYKLNVVQKDLSKTYVSEPIAKGVWRIQDFGGFRSNEDMYLFEGQGKALLIDTGMGKGDLAAYVRTLTALPVEVALTHGNRDHFLQVDQFKDSTVYLHAMDLTRLPPELITANYKWVKEGDVIDIGLGKRFEVVEVPGHSLGSVVYLDAANKIAVTGDAISSGSMVYMFAPTCAAVDQYLAGLKRLEAKVKKLDGLTLLVGHHYQEKVPLNGAAGKKLITDMRIAAEKVLSGELTGQLAKTARNNNTVELRQAYYGLAGLWYNPKNLVTDPAALGFLKITTSAGKAVLPQPIFSSFQTNYTAAVPGDVNSIEITPTAYWPGHKSISINGMAVKSGTAFKTGLTVGSNKFDIVVTSQSVSTRTYSVVVSK